MVHAGVLKKLAFYEENKEAVTISNCKVKMKNSRRGKDLEVLVTKNTDLSTSDQHFDLKTSSSAVSKGIKTEYTYTGVAVSRLSVEIGASFALFHR